MRLLVLVLVLSGVASSCQKETKSMRNTIVLPYVMSSSPDPFNILYSGDWVMSFHLWAPLVDIKESGKIIPILAESWLSDLEGKVWTFKLKKNLKWSDGTAMTIEQIHKSLNASLKGTSHSDLSRELKEIGIVEEDSIQLTLAKPLPNFLLTLTYPDWAIVHPENIVEENGKVSVDPKGPFSGPFTMNFVGKSMVVDKSELIKNPHYISQNFYEQEKANVRYLETCTEILENSESILTFKIYRDSLTEECREKFNNSEFNLISDQPNWILKADFSENARKTIPLEYRQKILVSILQLSKKEFKDFGVARATGLRGSHLKGSLTEKEFDHVLKKLELSIKKKNVEYNSPLKIVVMKDWSGWKSYNWMIKAFDRLSIHYKATVLSKKEFYGKFGSGKLGEVYDLIFIPLGVGDLEPDGTWRIAKKYFYSDIITEEELSSAFFENEPEKKEKHYKDLAEKLLTTASFIPLAMNSDYIGFHKSVKLEEGPAIRNGIDFTYLNQD